MQRCSTIVFPVNSQKTVTQTKEVKIVLCKNEIFKGNKHTQHVLSLHIEVSFSSSRIADLKLLRDIKKSMNMAGSEAHLSRDRI